MDLKQAAVWDECYFGLKANGWSKEEACKAAHRRVRGMSRRQINKEVTRILSGLPKDDCKVCLTPVLTGELCARCAEGNDPFPAASKIRPR
jgi:hypothetical protein